MGSAEHEPITGVWGLCPERGPGVQPLVRGQGAKPPEAEHFFCVVICLKWWKAAIYELFYGH